MENQPARLAIIQQIAAEVGVSVDEVRAVIYGEGPVHSDKLQPIIDALARDGQRTVCFCAVWKSEPLKNLLRNLPRYDYYGEIIQGLNLYLYRRGYVSQILVNSFRLADYDYFKSIIVRRGNVGLINVAATATREARKACEAYGCPLLSLDYPASEDTTGQYIISIKSEAVIAEMVAYLHRLGHRRIAFVQGPQEKQSAIDRYTGYRAGLANTGLVPDEALVVGGDWNIPSGKTAAEQLLALPSPPTAIIASNDQMAFGVMQAVEARGLKIPDDISVVGFDDIALASMTRPPLTSVRVSMTEMGATAGEYMIKLLEGERPQPYHVYLPLNIVIRESTGPAPAKPE